MLVEINKHLIKSVRYGHPHLVNPEQLKTQISCYLVSDIILCRYEKG